MRIISFGSEVPFAFQSGLHGANRLASNSLLEAMVFAHRCYEDAANKFHTINDLPSIPDWNAKGTSELIPPYLDNQY